MEPLVSVIIPVYNVLPYLREALDSVINQTYKNLEIIVVDDGSTDGSGDVCNEYLSDPRVIVIHQENRGLSGARNTGLDRMTGEYVAFLDSDDAFMPETIERMVNAIIQNEAYSAVCGFRACYTEKHMNTPNVRKVEILSFYEQKNLSANEALNMLIADKICWAVWNKLYKSIVWNGIRFPEGRNYEDMQIMCQVIERCSKLVTVPGIHVYYRNRSGSITQSRTEKNILDYIKAFFSIENYINEHTLSVFQPEIVHLFLERYTRILSSFYAYLLMCPHSEKNRLQYKNEVLLRWKQLEGDSCQLQSRITQRLFLYTPILIPLAQSCWQFAKKVLRKAQA